MVKRCFRYSYQRKTAPDRGDLWWSEKKVSEEEKKDDKASDAQHGTNYTLFMFSY